MCHLEIDFDREVLALFCSSNCHLNGNNLYFQKCIIKFRFALNLKNNYSL